VHFEFAQYITKLVERCDFLQELGLAADIALSRAFDAALRVASVDDCSSPAFGAVVSNFAFAAGRLVLPHLAGEDVQKAAPLKIAEVVIKVAGQDAAAKKHYFTLKSGGLGYVNATPSAHFCAEFLSGVLHRGAIVLLCREPFVIGAEYPQDQLTAMPQRLVVSWEDVQRRGRQNANEDFQKFDAVLQKKGELSADDLLMALALLADAELEIEPYLLGLGGSQNVPWLFRRFARDWRRLWSECGAPADALSSISFDWLTYGECPELPGLGAGVCRAAADAIRLIFSWRKVYFGSVRGRPAAHIVGMLMQAVRLFYSYYNQPKCRTAYRQAPVAAVRLGVMTKVLGELVEETLAALEFSCGMPNFVLKID